MKAIVYYEYGSPDVLQLVDLPKPSINEDDVLVKVHASSVNAQDWHLMRADPFLVRLMAGIQKPKYPILGSDLAGQVEAVGSKVTQYKPGDEVFGLGGTSSLFIGAFAEYVSNPEDRLALKPARLTFEEAAAVPSAAIAALQGLRDHGHIQPGQKVLINGASGGVGTFAVQIAKSFGAEVTGVCSTRNVETARSLGADHVIDYTQEDPTQDAQRYDLIFDNVGNPSQYRRFYERSLNPAGICVVCAGSFYLRLIQGPWMSMTGGNKIGTYQTEPNQGDLLFMKELTDSGKVVPVIDRRYPLSQIPEAVRYLEEGHAKGKVIITVHEEGD